MSLLSDELVAKALAVKSAEELFILAEENDMPISKEDSEMYFKMICESRNQAR